jgi:hypothetical protein
MSPKQITTVPNTLRGAKKQSSQTLQMKNAAYRQVPMKSKITIMTALACLALAITGCEKSTHIATQAGGHQVRAIIAGNHSIDSQPDQGTISSRFGKVTIERARVRIDDAAWAAIPEAVPIEVTVSRHKVLLTAGPVTVERTR